MRNRLKKLGILAVFVAASFVGVKGSAAAGPSMGSVSLPAQATPASLASQTHFSVNTPPIIDPISWPGDVQQALAVYYNGVPGLLEVYTIACWDPMFDVVGPSFSWECAQYHSNPFNSNASENAVAAQFVIGSLGTTGFDQCSWLTPYDLTNLTCDGNSANTITPGNASPAQSGSLMPNLDPYVGKTINLFAAENWCSALAPPGYDLASNWTTTQSYIHCYGSSDTAGIGLMARSTASVDATPVVEKVKLAIQAGPNDCHVPKVKGLTLRKAKVRLHRANCRAAVRYVKGARAGRVRYQPLKVGTGRPRGYKVKLAVVR